MSDRCISVVSEHNVASMLSHPASATGATRPADADLALAVPLVTHLDALRDSLGVTVPELAAMIGNDRTHLWRVFAGQVTATPDLLSRCLIALGGKVAARSKPVAARRRAET